MSGPSACPARSPGGAAAGAQRGGRTDPGSGKKQSDWQTEVVYRGRNQDFAVSTKAWVCSVSRRASQVVSCCSAQLHARVAHLRELRVRVDGCVQQLGWSRLAQCDHFLRGSGATPAPVAMLEWVHDSCLYYQQAILRINNTLSVIVEDDDASRCNLKSAFQEEDESKKQLQGCVVQRGPGRSTAAASPRPRHSASLVTCIEHNVRHLCRNVGTHVLLRAGEWPAVSAPVRMPRTAATAVSSHMLNKPHETALKF
ncbi:uncharacterized protein LOC134534367 isoform X2 [Bacillus rossius redtenbacheri]|uniref:uncharacterized protein LOC134534367 isoform X2 n=1 Tax=Bacillus rossius redtenbacheri TaxID=93214 RepID=UPI002FDE7722